MGPGPVVVGEAKAKNGVKQQKEKKNQAVDWEGRKGGALSPPQTPAQFASPADFFFRLFPSQQSLLPGWDSGGRANFL